MGQCRLKQRTYYDYLIDADIRICKGIPRIENQKTRYLLKELAFIYNAVFRKKEAFQPLF